MRNTGTSQVHDNEQAFIGELDAYLLGEGTHRRLWQLLGAHPVDDHGTAGQSIVAWLRLEEGRWTELLNTDAAIYGGSNAGNLGAAEADAGGQVPDLTPPGGVRSGT